MEFVDAFNPEDPLYRPWNERAILLVDLDAFFASVEQHDHPEWRGKPVIVGGDPDKHGVVSTCSYEARTFGVRSAMPSATAHQLCPDAIWTNGHFDRYREMSDAVMAILRDETPFVQQVSIDEAFLDVTPTAYNREHPVSIAHRIQKKIEELGVTASIGIGVSKAVAKTASDMDKPRGMTVVYPGSEVSFLGSLPIRTMSGIGAAAEKILQSYNIRTLRDLAQADEDVLHKAFGIRAGMMRARALGQDESDIEVSTAPKSISNEMTFSNLLTKRDEIEAAIATTCAKVGRRARRKGLYGTTLSLKVRYADRSVHSIQRKLPQPSNDDLAWFPLLKAMLGDVWAPGMSIRLLGVGLTGLTETQGEQSALFNFDEAPQDTQALNNEEKRKSLLAATDSLKERFGESSVRFGRELRNEDNLTGSSSKNPQDYK